MTSVELINICLDNNMPIFCGLNPQYEVKTLHVSVDRANINLKSFRSGPEPSEITYSTKTITRLPPPPYLAMWYHDGATYPATLHVNLIGEVKTYAVILHIQRSAMPADPELRTLVIDRLIPTVASDACRYFSFVRAKFPKFDPTGSMEASFLKRLRSAFE